VREIKFRAWDVINGKMYPIAFPSWNGMVEGKVDFKDHVVEVVDSDGDDQPILMQFTGLLDRNDKEIYVGDIIESDKNCIFDQGRKACAVEFKEGCYVTSDTGVPVSILINSFKPVVIGNIYENPELLNP